jgi:hypothetical protein
MSTYSDPKYGLKRRVIFPNVDSIASAAVHPDLISFPTKTKILKFGIIAQDNDVRVSSNTVLDLIIAGATAATLAQFTFSAAAVIAATDVATGDTITATTLAANETLQGAVGVIGSAGNFQYYIDVQEQFAVADSA